jgi:hypothetical protein
MIISLARIALLTIGVLGFGHAHALENLRCGSVLISIGDSRLEVEHKCGVPDDVAETFVLQRRSRSVQARPIQQEHMGYKERVAYKEEEVIEIPVELWTYNFGSNRLMSRLHFVAGRLTQIETLGYGFNR